MMDAALVELEGLLERLRAVNHSLARRLEAEGYGLSAVQGVMLVRLIERPLRVSALLDKADNFQQTYHSRKLVKAGYVHIEASREDGRAKLVTLTVKGRRAAEVAREALAVAMRRPSRRSTPSAPATAAP